MRSILLLISLALLFERLFWHFSQPIILREMRLPENIHDHPPSIIFCQVHIIDAPPRSKFHGSNLFLCIKDRREPLRPSKLPRSHSGPQDCGKSRLSQANTSVQHKPMMATARGSGASGFLLFRWIGSLLFIEPHPYGRSAYRWPNLIAPALYALQGNPQLALADS